MTRKQKQVLELWNKGIAPARIAKQLDMDAQTVRSIITQNCGMIFKEK